MSKDNDQLPKVLLSECRNTLMPHLHFADIMQARLAELWGVGC